ncbi:hypothetical protein [Pseudanabaena sp. Chao 1811]|uniref:hypothetical protein n=1 Tax=Pseudanabaena sp. Chao 1811 TaxID=2963092 RepID=UPI0022F3DEE8|nr:hypothetical protein [Pseudanabaena sp. Chao 1811]
MTNLGSITYMRQIQEEKSFLQQGQICLKDLAEYSEKIKVLLFEDLEILDEGKIKPSTDILLIFTLSKLLSQFHRDLLVANARIDKLESLTDELANDLALKEHQLNQMRYHVEESNTLGSWQRRNSWNNKTEGDRLCSGSMDN